jgi:VCBS repeat-containing protein
VTYTPTTNYTGSDSFTFTVNDGALTSTAATVSVTIGNTAPVANGQSQTTAEDTPLAIALSATDANGDPLSFAIVANPTHGTLGSIGTPSCSAGTCTALVTYTPAANYNGADSFTFKANDGVSDSNIATVSLTMTPVNDAPVSNAQSPATAEDTAAVIALTATDLDSPSLTFAIGTAPTHGTLGSIGAPSCTPTGSGSSCTASVTYTPAANYNGPDSFTFTTNDGSLTSAVATVSLTVTAVNDSPTANGQTVSTAKNTALPITLSGSDIDSAALTFSIVTNPANGTLGSIGTPSCTPSGSGSNCTASVTYTPTTNFTGSDSFTFRVNDGALNSTAATVTVSIGNTAPAANGQSQTTAEDAAKVITLSGTDANGDALTFAIGTAPTHGTLGAIGTPSCAAGSCTASVTYTPAANYNGTDSFTFTVNDGSLTSPAAMVSLTITAVNDAPVSNSQSQTTPEDTAKVITLSANDLDSASLTFAIGTAPTHGTLGSIGAPSCTPTGSGSSCTASVTYTPAANYNGPDSFTFTTSDGSLTSAGATVSLTVTAVNDAPTANGQTVSTAKNTALPITLAGSDIDSAALTFAIGTAPAHGTLGSIATPSCTPAGSGSSCTASVTYAPAANYTGSDSFTFVTNDGTLNSIAATVTVSIGDTAPVANGQGGVTTSEDTAVVITLSGTDANGDALTFAIGTSPTHGTLGAIGTPSCAGGSCTAAVTYTPALNYNGTDSFTFTVNDGSLTSTAATVGLTVTAVNDAPVSNSQSVTTAEDTAKVITLSANDVDSASLTFTITGTPTQGTLGTLGSPSCTPSGSGATCTAQVTYTPGLNYNGSDSFTFTTNDGSLASAAGTVSLTVTAVNDPPVAVADSATVAKNSSNNAINVLANDTDVEGNTLTVTAVTAPLNGTAAVGTGGANVTYTPNANFSGSDNFTYTVSDGNGGTAVGTVTISVGNSAPVASGQTVTTPEDTAAAITLSATDANNDTLSFAIVTGPTHGTLGTLGAPNCAAGTCTASVTYTPAANYSGTDSFTFRVNDGSLNSNTATVSLTIPAVNDTPVATGQSVTVPKNFSTTITLAGSDVDSGALLFSIVTNPTHGTLGSITGTSCTPSGSGSSCTATVAYTPAANYSGSDSFTFKVNDGALDSSPATVSITVGNTAPVANAQSLTTAEDTALTVTLSGTDANGDALTFSIGTAPTHGTLGAIGSPSCAGGSCTAQATYTPAANYNGADSFTFKVNDGTLDSNTATVSLTITSVNDAPVGTGQSVTTAEDTAKVITLAATDVDNAALTFAVGTAPTHGTLGAITGTTCTPSGSGSSCTAQVTYTPTANYPFTNAGNGSDSFTFTANDGSASSTAATVSLTITPVNDTPVAVNDNVTVAANSSNNVIAVLGNDTDADGDALTVTAVSAPSNGTASVGTGGANVVYTPTAGYSGPDSFTYTISDGQGGTSTATVGLTVTVVNSAPVAGGQSVTTAEDTAKLITLSATDANNDTLSFAIVTGPTHGTLGALGAPSCAAGTCTAQVTYTPAANYNGSDSFTFKANDGLADSNVATVSLTITAVNDAPVSNPQGVTTAEDTAVTITLSGTDIDSGSLTFAATAPSNGTLGAITGTSCTPSGSGSNCTAQVTYTPAANSNGTDSFTFTVNDGSSTSPASTVSLTITAVNDTPLANGQSVTSPKNFSSVITLTASDADSAALTFAIGTAPTHGTLGSLGSPSCTPSGAGSSCTAQVTYTPTTNYTGSDSFTFTANDGSLTSAAATVSVTVANNPPAANGQSVTAVEDSALVIVLSGSDANGDSLTFAIGTAPTHGALGAIGTPSCSAGSCTATVTYTPAANYNGSDGFTFTVNDGTAASGAATVSITVTAFNDAPVSNGQSVTTAEDSPLLITLSGTDIDSASLTFAVGTAPPHGTLGGITGTTCTPSGSGSSCTAQVTYTPATNYNGSDSFTFTTNDGSTSSAAATVAITVTAVNDPPTFTTISNQTVAEDSGSHNVTITGISPGPADEAGQTVTLTATSSNPAIVPNPTVSAVVSGSATLTFTEASNANGTVTITVTANDGQAVNNTYSSPFTITVTPVNDAPAATTPSPVTTAEDTAAVITLSGTDIDSASLTFAIGAAPLHGTLGAIGTPSCTPSGSGSSCTATVTYTPAANYNGSDSFTFTTNDGSLTSTAATVSITVTAVNDTPTANGQSQTTAEDTALVITLSATDTDSASLTFAIGAAPLHGTLGAIGTPSCTPSGSGSSCTATVTYTPAANYNGSDSFTFTTNDGLLTSAAATVSLTMTAVNDAPTANGQSVNTPVDTPVTISLAGSDVDGGSLTFAVGTPPAQGTLGAIGTPTCAAGSCTAQVTYTPGAGYSGGDSFTFTTNDGLLSSAPATVSITVGP